MTTSVSTCLLCLALPSFGIDCQQLMPHEDRSISSYTVEVRVRTRDGAPVQKVLISNPDSGAQGFTDPKGEITFRVDGFEGTAVSFRVERTPDGIVEVDDSTVHRMILKSIVGQKAAADPNKGVLTYDILMRRTREVYVVLVVTKGVADLPVSANGVQLGKLNSLGAAAFRIKGQPGEELKVIIQTEQRQHELTQDNPEQTFVLPAASSILSFASTLALVPESMGQNRAKPIITFGPKTTKRRPSRQPSSSPPKPDQPTVAGPGQVPFRGVELK